MIVKMRKGWMRKGWKLGRATVIVRMRKGWNEERMEAGEGHSDS